MISPHLLQLLSAKEHGNRFLRDMKLESRKTRPGGALAGALCCSNSRKARRLLRKLFQEAGAAGVASSFVPAASSLTTS